MKEITKSSGIISKIKTGEKTAAILSHIIFGVVSIITSRAVMPKGLVPFGVSMVAAAPYEYLPSAAIGAFLGYFIPAVSGGGFRYIAATISVLFIRILLSSYKSVSKNPIFICSLPLLSLAATAPVMAKSHTAPALISEVFLSALAAGVMLISFKAMTHRKAGFSADELSAFIIFVAILLTGISRINAGGIYLYRSLCVLLVLISAKYGGTAVSTAMGAAAAFCCLLSSGDSSIGLIFVIMGLTAGAFRSYGKWVMSFVVFTASLIGMVLTDGVFRPSVFAETAIAATVFLSMPRHFGAEVGKFFSFYPKISMQSDIRKMVKIKLLDAADALYDVKNTVNEVSNRLSIINAPDFSNVTAEIENTACSGCRLRIHCFETKRGDTSEAITSLINAYKKGEENPYNSLPEEFKIRCLKTENFCDNAIKVYEKYSKRLAAENRTKEIREVVSEQFEGISVMLRATADEIVGYERFDKGAAIAVAAALKNIDIFASEAVCRVDKFGRMRVKIKATKQRDTVLNKMEIVKAIENSLDRDFSAPVINDVGKDVYIALSEAPLYKVATGVSQITASGNSMCGDSFRFITDGFGRFYIVLSDGMGTGGAAAVDSALSSALFTRLIKSGINLESALKIINSSMLFKSTNESTATVDIALIDLFNGHTEIYKAGAAPSLIKHGNRIGTATGRSLPIGILSDVSFDKSVIRLKEKDVVLVMSDGATGDGLEWMKRELENNSEATPQSLAENIALAARRHRSDGHEDDITVIAAVIEKTVK
ncbi:MAG: SpoIIE family protein phosphatase [Clostridia bacterium]|nr:SpoIIE family protein phosphatase [Clostridia bacterium]